MSIQEDPIVIVAAARTPMGGFRGELTGLGCTELGASVIGAGIERSGLSSDSVDQVIMGCCLPAGLGQAPARQAALGAGLTEATPATTVNKMCGSGMQAAILAHDMLAAGSATVAVAGGMESMSNAPHLLPQSRGGSRLGAGELKDHMFLDGLEDAYEPGRLMGSFAEETAQKLGFSREQQDEFAIRSLERAREATESGAFAGEIVPVTVKSRKVEVEVATDEQPRNADLSKIPKLKPAFAKDGTVTAANASSISDGAAALVLMRAAEAKRRGLEPLATIRGHAVHAQAPAEFSLAPIGAIRRLLDGVGWSAPEVDLYEINEAFAVVTMAAMQALELDPDRVNVHGGACALGHPIGASGARVIVTLLGAMERRGVSKGVASLCIGGGEATALAIER